MHKHGVVYTVKQRMQRQLACGVNKNGLPAVLNVTNAMLFTVLFAALFIFAAGRHPSVWFLPGMWKGDV